MKTKTAEEKANKRFPNVSFGKDVESEYTYRTNEIRLLQRFAYMEGYNEAYNEAWSDLKKESIKNQAFTIVQILEVPALFKIVDKDGKTLFIGNEDDCKFLFPNCRNI